MEPPNLIAIEEMNAELIRTDWVTESWGEISHRQEVRHGSFKMGMRKVLTYHCQATVSFHRFLVVLGCCVDGPLASGPTICWTREGFECDQTIPLVGLAEIRLPFLDWLFLGEVLWRVSGGKSGPSGTSFWVQDEDSTTRPMTNDWKIQSEIPRLWCF